MLRPPGIEPGRFVVSLDTVWYARLLLLFSASAATDTESKSFDCALVSMMEKIMTIQRILTIIYINVIIYVVIHYLFVQDG